MLTDEAKVGVATPAFVYNMQSIVNRLTSLKKQVFSSCKVLFPLKCFSLYDALLLFGKEVEGFACSSLFEARLAREALPEGKSVHMTCPGLRDDEVRVISELSDYVSFNSISQLKRYYEEMRRKCSCGVRVNPGLSFVADQRYDPCRRNSKLGVPMDAMKTFWDERDQFQIEGIHFHSNCESLDHGQLFEVVSHLSSRMSSILAKLKWVNMGGGYLFGERGAEGGLTESISLLRSNYDVEVFFEPGKGMVGSFGYIVSSVRDIIESNGHKVAILDTTVNHMPEVFEYQYRPDIAEEIEDGRFSYILTGASCLAGDLFGEYRFDEPLEIGSRIVFQEMGAYTLVKANMFNGINLPTIYGYTLDGKLELKRQFTYGDFLSRCGANSNVYV